MLRAPGSKKSSVKKVAPTLESIKTKLVFIEQGKVKNYKNVYETIQSAEKILTKKFDEDLFRICLKVIEKWYDRDPIGDLSILFINIYKKDKTAFAKAVKKHIKDPDKTDILITLDSHLESTGN